MTWMQLYGYSMNTVGILKKRMGFIFHRQLLTSDIKMDEGLLTKLENAFLWNLHLN